MNSNNEIKSVVVFAGTAWQCGMVKSLLENAEIEAYLKDDIIGTLSPWWAAPGGAGAVKVLVASSDYEKAKMIVDEYEENLKEDN